MTQTEEKKAQSALSFESTMETLRQAESALPDYSSSYDGEIARLYEQIISRPAFRYDIGADPLYQSMRDQAVSTGRLAMRDSMGQAAALTGGYGSSYAQSVGQQQYGLYLQKLSERMPELYKAAYERYQSEGEELRGQLGTASALAQAEYGREKDRRQAAAELEQQSYERRWKSYQSLISVISQSGYEPDDGELAEAGMNRTMAEALRREYLRANGLSEDGGVWGGMDTAAPSGGSAGGSTGGSAAAGSKEQIKLQSIQSSAGSGKHRRN